MSEHHCDVPHCDGTRLGHDLAVDFPEETARVDNELRRLAEPLDGLRVNPANLQVDSTATDPHLPPVGAAGEREERAVNQETDECDCGADGGEGCWCCTEDCPEDCMADHRGEQ